MKIKFSGHYADGEFFVMTAKSFEQFGIMTYNLIESGATIETVEYK